MRPDRRRSGRSPRVRARTGADSVAAPSTSATVTPNPVYLERGGMRTVEDADGNRLVVRKDGGESLLVADPTTGDEWYVDRDAVSPVDGQSALATAAGGVPEPTRRVLAAVPDEAALAVRLELVDGGPVAVRDLLARYDLCESDLHGRLAELRAAGLLEEATVAGERGYDATDLATEAATALRGDDSEPDA